MSNVEIVKGDGVIEIVFARPEKKNALTSAMYKAATEALQESERDPSVGAVLIRGSGGVFTAGNDIADFLNNARERDGLQAFGFIKTIALCQTPIVAAVEGPAVGVGTTMLFHCDLVYAAPDARFSMPFIDLGLVPEAGSSLLAPMRAGMARASEWLLLGEAFSAQQAQEAGLVNGVVPTQELYAKASAQAVRLAKKPRAALAATRKLLRGDLSALTARIDEEGAAFAAALQSGEAKAAFMAFLAKAK